MQALILLSEFRDAQQVADFCETHNLRYWLAENLVQVQALLAEQPLDFIFLDLALPDTIWRPLARRVQEQHPQAQVIGVISATSAWTAVQLRQAGVHLILHRPLTAERIEQTLLRSPRYQAQTLGLHQLVLPPAKLQFPVRFKIILPYLLVSLVVVILGLLLMNRLIVETMEERFQRQLVDAGVMTADRMVQEELALLATWRALAFTSDVPERVAQGDAAGVRTLVLPTVINDGVDAVDFIALGTASTLLSLRQNAQPAVYAALTDVSFAQVPFVEDAFRQSSSGTYKRYAGLFHDQGRDFLYVVGPLLDLHQQSTGLLLVGRDVSNLAGEIKQGVLANISFYDQHGNAIHSTLGAIALPPAIVPEQLAQIVQNQDRSSLVRAVSAGSSDYHEILGVWRTSRGDVLGFYGTALPRTLFIRIANDYRFQLALWVILAILVVIILGLYLANRITTPLVRLIRAAGAVAGGNLNVQVDMSGADEIGLLVASFNHMVQQLRENVIYRDLLGRAVSLPVREQLRQSFQGGELQLTGQTVMATVLMSDIRNFTAISERADSTTVLRWLNEYFSELAPLISSNQGVISTFAGDSLVAFFGVLPKPLTLSDGAYSACLAATQMQMLINQLNERRQRRGDPPLITGIALHSGVVTAGSLGAAERMQYTIVGDTVNATSRLGEFTKVFHETIVVASAQTVNALGRRSAEFHLKALGDYELRGKLAAMTVYRIDGYIAATAATSAPLQWRVLP